MSPLVHQFAVSTLTIAAQRVGSSWQWYIIRAAGFVAAALLILLMLSGIGQVTGFTYRFIEPVKAWALHKAMAFALGISIAVHIFFLLFDHFVSINLVQLFVPFTSHVNNGTKLLGINVSSLAVAFGVFAMYGVAIIILSSLGWIDTKKKTWRWLHYTSYFVMLLVFLHGLSVGTDLRYGTFRAGWLFLILLLVLAVVSRLRHVGGLRETESPPQ